MLCEREGNRMIAGADKGEGEAGVHQNTMSDNFSNIIDRMIRNADNGKWNLLCSLK